MPEQFERARRSIRRIGLIILAVVVLTAIAERSELLRAIDRVIIRHRPTFLGAAIALTIVGFTVFMGTIIYALVIQGPSEPPSRALGAEVSFRELNRAYRAKAWRTERFWRLTFLTILGAMIMALGAFSVIFVLGPAFARALVAAAVLYAVWRTSWAFARI